MRDYDSNLPLVIVHIPKTAGTSFGEILKGWYGHNLLPHYFNDATDEMPPRHNLTQMQSLGGPLAIYGHFNRKRGFGVEHYYPQVEQFVTILREPFDIAVSAYFFMRKNRAHWKDQSRIPSANLQDHILSTSGSFLDFFPQEVTFDNYKEVIETRFVEIGVTEHLSESIERIARKLNHEYKTDSLLRLNVTEWDQEIPADFREAFVERHPLAYTVYRYVADSYVVKGSSLPSK